MIYDNCIIQAPDGENLSRCSRKKIDWYLQRDLGKIVADNPVTLRLNFEPSGRRAADDPLMMEGKPNVCVVCGVAENLTRHHIIPYSFIRHMRIEYKMDIIRDILPLCTECHNRYEAFSQTKRQNLAKQFNVSIGNKEQPNTRKIAGIARALLRYSDQIPPYRREELTQCIQKFVGRPINQQDLEWLAEIRSPTQPSPSSEIARIANEDYNQFAQEWREHFVNTMKPRFMPDLWRVDRKVVPEDVWVPDRVRRQEAI